MKFLSRKLKIHIWFFTILLLSNSCKESDYSYIASPNQSDGRFPYVEFNSVETFSFNRDTLDSTKDIFEILDKTIYNTQIAASARKIKSLDYAEVDTIRSILGTDKQDLVFDITYCDPIFRDAIIFKNVEKIVGWIDICFQCNKIKFSDRKEYEIAAHRWEQLKEYLISIGHPIFE